MEGEVARRPPWRKRIQYGQTRRLVSQLLKLGYAVERAVTA
jgi:hypothetical protein